MSLLDGALKKSQGFSLDGLKSMRANRVYDKLAFLVAITAGCAVVSGLTVGKSATVGALIIPAFVVALGCAIAGQFKPHLAKKVAPVYAVAEGLILGVISRAFAAGSNGIIPTAVILTSALFVGCLLVFRTGVVKVTPRFIQMTAVAGMALFALYFAALFGLKVPGIGELGPKGMIFGVIGLGVGLSYLFIDFDKIQKAEEAGALSDTAEWFLAFQLLLSLVMVYINVLRILASSQRRR
jgi:uncharacterized YccA/Bax inhibitor family protein